MSNLSDFTKICTCSTIRIEILKLVYILISWKNTFSLLKLFTTRWFSWLSSTIVNSLWLSPHLPLNFLLFITWIRFQTTELGLFPLFYKTSKVRIQIVALFSSWVAFYCHSTLWNLILKKLFIGYVQRSFYIQLLSYISGLTTPFFLLLCLVYIFTLSP